MPSGHQPQERQPAEPAQAPGWAPLPAVRAPMPDMVAAQLPEVPEQAQGCAAVAELALGPSAGKLQLRWAAGPVPAAALPDWPALAPVQAPELAG